MSNSSRNRRSRRNKARKTAAAEAQNDGNAPPPPRVTMLSLPFELIVRIHVLAANPDYIQVCRRINAAVSTCPPPTVAKYFVNRYDGPDKQPTVLTHSVAAPIVTTTVVAHVVKLCATIGWKQDPIAPLPLRLNGSRRQVRGVADKLLVHLLEAGLVCSSEYDSLLHNAVLHQHVSLAKLLLKIVLRVDTKDIILAIRLRSLELVKVLCQHPLQPTRKGQEPGAYISHPIITAALNRPFIYAYVHEVLCSEITSTQLNHRAWFDRDGEECAREIL